MTENRRLGIGEDQRLCLVTTEFIPIIIIYGGTLQPLITCTKNMNYLSPTFQSYCSKSYSIQMNEFLIHYRAWSTYLAFKKEEEKRAANVTKWPVQQLVFIFINYQKPQS